MRLKWIMSVCVVFIMQLGFAQSESDEQSVDFEVLKNLELFELVYRNVDINYVDQPDPGALMKAAIDAMLMELDPYTNYIPESLIEDYKLMTTGQYGGIGAIIQRVGDRVAIMDPHLNYPAQKSGLRAGDLFKEIDGRDVKELTYEEISEKLKGKPGSEIVIKVERGDEIIEKTLVREEVKLSSVPYHGMVNEEIGYIKFTSFTRDVSRDILEAFANLKSQGMNKLIFDLRGNGGGLLIEAVKVVNFFVSKGSSIVSIKGRKQEDNRGYTAAVKPVDLDIPIVLLIDGGSASASEIVSGALQDLDRAVILGETSFGKGLVQRPLDLKYNARVKVTIAKYYTPSGRCIQKLDYSNRKVGNDAGAISDSLITTFKTKNGREVIDGRGVEPDVKVDLLDMSRLTITLLKENIIFNYATKFREEHDQITSARDFDLSEADYDDFKKYVLEQDFTYSTASYEKMQELREVAKHEHFMKEGSEEFDKLMKKFEPSKERDLDKFKEELVMILEDEIVGRFYFAKGRVEHSLSVDNFILEAVEILNDIPRYNSILKIQ